MKREYWLSREMVPQLRFERDFADPTGDDTAFDIRRIEIDLGKWLEPKRAS